MSEITIPKHLLTPEARGAIEKALDTPDLKKVVELSVGNVSRRKEIDWVVSIKTEIDKSASKLTDEEWDTVFEEKMEQKVQDYINCFRKEIGQYLSGDTGQQFNVVSFPSGFMIRFKQASHISNSDTFEGEVSSIEEAFQTLKETPEKWASKGSLKSIKKAFTESSEYKGNTQFLFLGDHTVIISGKDDDYWAAESAKSDVDGFIDFVREKQKKLGIYPK